MSYKIKFVDHCIELNDLAHYINLKLDVVNNPQWQDDLESRFDVLCLDFAAQNNVVYEVIDNVHAFYPIHMRDNVDLKQVIFSIN